VISTNLLFAKITGARGENGGGLNENKQRRFGNDKRV
jgi:hypothetical protein